MSRWRIAMALLVMAAVWSEGASAQPYPSRPIRFILPYPAGGSYDAVARLISQKLTERWGQQVLVDNRPGAAGRIGMEVAVKATPDGYNLVMLGNNQTIVPSVYHKVPYDLERDVTTVTLLATITNVLVVYHTVPANSVSELIALAKAKPGTIHFGSGGTGGITHLAGELFKSMATVQIVHVPYKGGALAVNDLVGGQIQMMLLNMLSASPHVKSGRLKGLAVTTLKRSSFMPELPTLDEVGLRGYEVVEWYGVAVPAGTPRAVLAKLHAELVAAVNSGEVKEKLARQMTEPVTTTPAEFAVFLKADLAKYAKIVKNAGIRPE